MQVLKRIKQLRHLMTTITINIIRLGNREISDARYDELFKELVMLEGKYPQYAVLILRLKE